VLIQERAPAVVQVSALTWLKESSNAEVMAENLDHCATDEGKGTVQRGAGSWLRGA